MVKKSGWTLGDLQKIPLSDWWDSDLIAGLEFFATLQLRTPLRVLRWHGKVHTNRNQPPPKVATEGWEGIWLPKTKTWKELGGADIPRFEPSTVASDIGEVDPSEYFPYLLGIHEITEAKLPISVRLTQLREFLSRPEWSQFNDAHGTEAVLGLIGPSGSAK
jgi:hypothetical protein